MRPGPDELDAVRDEATAAMGAWGAPAGAWQVVGVVRGSLGAELRPVVAFEDQRYVVRRQPPDLREDDAHFRHAFMRHLRGEGLPVPPLRARPGGGTYAVVAGEIYELQAWLGGAPYDPDGPDTTRQIAAAATTLGALHQASAVYAGEPSRWPEGRSPQAVASAYLDLIQRAAARDDITPAVAAATTRIAESAAERIAAASQALGVVPGPPELHIHGDYQPRNLAFGADDTTAIYDFDAVHWARRLDELAYALLAFTGVRERAEGPAEPLAGDGLDILRAHAFLHAYGQVAPPAEDEAPLLGDAIALLFPVVVANGIAEDLMFADDYGGPPPEAEILPRLEWADAFWLWLDRYRGVLAEAWAAAEG